jgi:hypothetical protein
MFPLGLVIGAAAGAAGAIIFGRHLVEQGRPLAKAALKATLTALHEARVRGAEIEEAVEDLYAEAKSEVTKEIFESAMAAAVAKAKAAAEESAEANLGNPGDQSSSDGSASRTRTKRSGAGPTNG